MDYFKYCCLPLIGDLLPAWPPPASAECVPQLPTGYLAKHSLRGGRFYKDLYSERRPDQTFRLWSALHTQDAATPTWAVFAVTTVLQCHVPLAQTQDSCSFPSLSYIHCAGSCQHWMCSEPAFHSFSTLPSSDGSSFPPALPMGCGITPDCQLISAERQVENFIWENASRTSIWIRAPGGSCLVSKHRGCWTPSWPGTSKMMLPHSINVSCNLSHITWVTLGNQKSQWPPNSPSTQSYHSRLGKGAKEPLDQAVCGKQWVKGGAGEELECKDRWPGKGFIPKGGMYQTSLGGDCSSKNNNADFFLPQNKKRGLVWCADITAGRWSSQGVPRSTINKWQLLLYTLHFRTILILTACFIFEETPPIEYHLGTHLSKAQI